ncbi:YigZ family protein [Campylobacterota bacterium]
MKFVQEHTTDTLEIKQSKFIAHLVPYAMYDLTLEQLKEEHPKARHFVVAWRYINEFDQVVEHCSDDGEPKGTSGKPTLAVLAGNELINSAVIIVRYFGGTKLGTGGLVRAYSDACNTVIQKSELLPYVKLHNYIFSVAYSDISLVEYRLQELKIDIKNKAFDEKGAVFTITSEKEVWKGFYKESERIIEMKH